MCLSIVSLSNIQMANEFFFDTEFHIKMPFLQQTLSFIYIHHLNYFKNIKWNIYNKFQL